MKKKILAFDGGGIRGIIAATFLKNLEEKTGISFHEKADLFAGTSTGAIIAGTLASGMTAKEIFDFYFYKSQNAFEKKKESFETFLHIDAKFSTKNLYQTLKAAFTSKGVNPHLSLKKFPKKIVIPTVNLDNKNLHRWRCEILNNIEEESENISLIDAIMRSTSAPTFFPSYQDCVDGGIAANDPSILAYALFRSYFEEEPILLSFGTGYTEHAIPKGEKWGVFSWILDLGSKGRATKTPLLSMLFDVQEELPSQLCQLLLKEAYLRLDLKLEEAVNLDDVSKIPFLVEETEKFIQNASFDWEKVCEWTASHF